MDNSIDQQFIEFVVKSLVNNPDDVSIERTIDEKGVLLELTVNPEDLGRVIGKRGATAQSLRTLLRALGTKNDARYNLKIVDNGEPRPERNYDDRPQTAQARTSSTSDDNSDTQDEEASEAQPTEASAKEQEAPESVADASQEEVDHSDAVSKTRAELADLDDLDI
jgi:predicted RNA-binding protein YlqC (UPF0109 family)